MLLFTRLPLLRSEQPIDSYMSREAAFLANNWVFAAIAFATLWGTFFPMFSEILTGERISVAAPFFNKVNGPLFLVLLLLMGVGPLMGWRHTSVAAFRKQFTWPLVAAAVVVVWCSSSHAACIRSSALPSGLCDGDHRAGVRARRQCVRRTSGDNVFTAMGHLWSRNGRRYGGYLVHLGIVMIGVAVIGNEFYQQTTNVTLAPGRNRPGGRLQLSLPA